MVDRQLILKVSLWAKIPLMTKNTNVSTGVWTHRLCSWTHLTVKTGHSRTQPSEWCQVSSLARPPWEKTKPVPHYCWIQNMELCCKPYFNKPLGLHLLSNRNSSDVEVNILSMHVSTSAMINFHLYLHSILGLCISYLLAEIHLSQGGSPDTFKLAIHRKFSNLPQPYNRVHLHHFWQRQRMTKQPSNLKNADINCSCHLMAEYPS